MIRRPPRSTLDRSSAASDVYKRQKTSWPAWKLGRMTILPSHSMSVSYTHLRAHETGRNLVCRLLLEKKKNIFFFFLMIRRPPRSTLDRSSAASDVYKRQKTSWPAWKLGRMTILPSHSMSVSYTHLRAHETGRNLVCRLLLEKKKGASI